MKKSIKHLTVCIAFIAIAGLICLSCSKKETPKSEPQTRYTNLYSKGGVVHNELLSKFANKLLKSNSKFSLKLNNIALKYVGTRIGTLSRSVAPSTQELAELQNEINQAVAEEVLPVSISYLQDNGFYQNFLSVGIENPEPIINEVVNEIYTNATFSNEQYVNEVISENSLTFQSFVPDLKNLIENSSSSDLISQIDELKNSYLGQISDSVEALAIINGCETAKASFEYWNNSINTAYWDDIAINNVDVFTYSNRKTIARKVASSRSRNEIIASDAIGAIVGVVEGARIGALAGPGGAMVVGMAGMILRGAQASAGDYVKSKVLDWLGW